MKRKIKFRGKDDQGEWQEGHLLVQLGLHYILTPIWEMYQNEYVETDRSTKHIVNGYTVGQFTGLFDKNGIEIYEGDIVKFTKWNGKLVTGLVKWDDCNPCMCIEFKTEYKQTDWEFDFIKCGTMRIEVIGNIHDNPELIKD
jgi:uncharacterized phage protein (TIGR01671 family)